MQWQKEKVQKNKQRSTKHIHKSNYKDRVTGTPLRKKTSNWLLTPNTKRFLPIHSLQGNHSEFWSVEKHKAVNSTDNTISKMDTKTNNGPQNTTQKTEDKQWSAKYYTENWRQTMVRKILHRKLKTNNGPQNTTQKTEDKQWSVKYYTENLSKRTINPRGWTHVLHLRHPSWPLCCLFFDIRILITSLWYLQTLLSRTSI